MKRVWRAGLLAVSLLLMAAGLWPVTVRAEEASVTFGSNTYTVTGGEPFPMGVYIRGDVPVGDYYVELQYDNTVLEYRGGGDGEQDGVIMLEGTGDGNEVKYMLYFRPRREGNTEVAVQYARVYMAGDGERLELSVTAQGLAPVTLLPEETQSGEEPEEEEIPTSGVITVEGKDYAIVDLSEHLPKGFGESYGTVQGEYQGLAVTYLTDEQETARLLYLMDEESRFFFYAHSGALEKLYPCNMMTINGVQYYLLPADIFEDWQREMEAAGLLYIEGIPVIGRTAIEGSIYYIVNLEAYLPSGIDWAYQRVQGSCEGKAVTWLTNPSGTVRILYLMTEEAELYPYAYSEEQGRFYPCSMVRAGGEKYCFLSPYVCSVWPEGLTLSVIQQESVVYAMDMDGECGFYKLGTGNTLLPWDKKEGEAALYRQVMKLAMVFGSALLVAASAVLLTIRPLSSLSGRRKRKRQEALCSPEILEVGECPQPVRYGEKPGRDGAEEGPVIDLQDVTMRFRVATQNVSGIKEYVIQLLKKQISYRELLALDRVSFEVYRGEVMGIIGTNGSGKSTLLKIVSGALQPTAGRVTVDDRKVQLLTLGTGFDMELTAKENVYLNGAIIGYSREFLDEKYEEIVSFAGLEGFMEEKVKNFSSGMVSRLGFSIATAGEAAEILILDEVLSVGDEFFRRKSLAKIKEMIHGGSTVLLVSHSAETIISNCTRAVWIEKGVLRAVGDPKRVCEAYRKQKV